MYQPVNLQHPSEKGTNKKKLFLYYVFLPQSAYL